MILIINIIYKLLYKEEYLENKKISWQYFVKNIISKSSFLDNLYKFDAIKMNYETITELLYLQKRLGHTNKTTETSVQINFIGIPPGNHCLVLFAR